MRSRIGEYLVRAGLLTARDLETALAERQRTGERLGAVLVRSGLVSEKQMAEALALQLGFPSVDLAANPPDPAAIRLVPRDVALQHACIAIGLDKGVLTVAMADPLVFTVVQDLEQQTGHRITQAVATHTDIFAAIDAGYGETVPPVAADLAIAVAEGPAPVADLLDRLLTSAIESGATEIHVEPTNTSVLVRHRLDGVLTRAMEVPREVHEELIARLKLLAGMDVTEKLLPQDGRMRTAAAGGDVDFRVSTLRTLYGEKAIVRLLAPQKRTPDLHELGMSAVTLDEVRHLLRRQDGLVLVVGPAVSGKTTTACAAVKALQSDETNVATIEDPIEYRIPGVNQVQVDAAIALTFTAGLRAILRHDPDAILVGEIRDAGTARAVVDAAHGGHLVLATLRGDDAVTGAMRLAEFGVEPSAVASALSGVVAQRLVRRLCVHCRREHTPPPDVLRMLGVGDADAAGLTFFTAVGCDQCHHTGFRGRIGIFEVMRGNDAIRRLMASRASEHDIRDAAVVAGLVTLAEDGLAKVKSGTTTAEELLRAVRELREPRTLCAECGTVVGIDFSACPHCGTRLAVACSHCGRALQPGWNFCPYCARGADVARTPKRRIMRAVPGTKARRGPSESE